MPKVLDMEAVAADETVGPVIIVDGYKFQTIIDKEGVQRFPQNRIVRALLDTGKLDLNDIWAMADAGSFSRKELMTFYMDLGYSICGFADVFAKAEIINPLWADEDDGDEGDEP